MGRKWTASPAVYKIRCFVRYTYPILLDVTDRLVVIIGGGEVAVRKLNGLLAAGATRVRMVANSFSQSVPDHVERLQERYRAEHLRGAGLAFAATDDSEVNDAV